MTDIPSVKKYKRAFTRLRGEMTEYQYKMLRLHYHAPEHTLSATQMAEAMKWKTLDAANLHYGRFAGVLRDLLNRSSEFNIEMLCYFETDSRTDEILWVMHDNVAKALEELGWVKSHPRILASHGRAEKKDLDRVRAYIAASDWRFAKTMPQWPHWYVVRNWGHQRDFDFFARLIDKDGYIDSWGQKRWKYLVVDDFKYWLCDNVLNRAKPKLNAWVIKEGKKYVAKHGSRLAWQPR
jgi:hypothetical protein